MQKQKISVEKIIEKHEESLRDDERAITNPGFCNS